jgi:hypothetical protein
LSSDLAQVEAAGVTGVLRSQVIQLLK